MRARMLQQLNQVLQTRDTARGFIVNMPDVLFDTGKADLKPSARERLAKVAGILIAYPDIHVEIDGYTDSTGSLEFNERFSQQRAEAVRSYLGSQGVNSSSITTQGFGPSNPIASNETRVRPTAESASRNGGFGFVNWPGSRPERLVNVNANGDSMAPRTSESGPDGQPGSNQTTVPAGQPTTVPQQ